MLNSLHYFLQPAPSPNSVWNTDSLPSLWKSDGSPWSSPSCDNCSPDESVTNSENISIESENSKKVLIFIKLLCYVILLFITFFLSACESLSDT